MNQKSIIIYFSRAGENYAVGNIDKGNTEYIAQYIQSAINGDIFKVERDPDYSDNYNICVKESLMEWKQDILPPLKKQLNSIEQYDNVFIGGPIYFGVFPPPIKTQLKRLDFNNKNVYPFITHEGSGEANVINYLKDNCPGAKINDPLVIFGHQARDAEPEVKEWLEKIK